MKPTRYPSPSPNAYPSKPRPNDDSDPEYDAYAARFPTLFAAAVSDERAGSAAERLAPLFTTDAPRSEAAATNYFESVVTLEKTA